jgi:NADH:ubiquinone oxidoreductase subunit K
VRRLDVVSPVTAVLLGALGLALIAAWVALTYLTGDLQVSRDGAAPVLAVLAGLLGILVARRQPRNPEGWLLLGLAVADLAVVDSGLYAVLDYRVRHDQLPLGEAAMFVKDTAGTPLICVFALVILLFPDGRLTRRWAWVLWCYLAVVGVAAVGVLAGEAGALAGQHIQVDVNGGYSGPGSPAGVLAVLATIGGSALVVVPLFWVAFVARQVLTWRRSAGDRRAQLKWLMAGAVLAVAGLAMIAAGPSKDQTPGRILRDVAFLAVAALPVAIGVGILKYHLYDIDRLISRTLSYTLVTGVLVGVYAGLVLLATEVFGFRSTVAVAASTLAVAALFNPLWRRVQRSVDRRFYRARYDAEATVAAFATALKDAVDLDGICGDLAGVVHRALEPAHVSVWISRRR